MRRPSADEPEPPEGAAATGDLPVTVTSVRASLEPYNPQLTNHGIPAETVDFTIRSVSGDVSCRLAVLRAGRTVGTTVAEITPPPTPPASIKESVPVEGIKGATFNGNASNATVVCLQLSKA